MKNVLLVDDAMFIRNALKLILVKNGFNIVGEAGDGLQAVEQYKVLKPDIITMDITMPNMDGLQALKEIRKLDKMVKIVMVSAVGKEETVKEAIISGANSFILKPFDQEKVLKVMEKV